MPSSWPVAGHWDLAECYARPGRMNEAFAEMEHAYENRERNFISFPVFDDVWDRYRQDERYKKLLQKAGLAP